MPALGDGQQARARAIGDDLLSLPVAATMTAQALAAALRDSGDWLEAVAGLDTLVVRFDNVVMDPDVAAARLTRAVAELPEPAAVAKEVIEIPVAYGGEFGPDLDAVCTALGLSMEQFVSAHTSASHLVEMLGFTPGFAYLGRTNATPDVPRRKDPRQRVAAGSVGIAGGRTGLYALAGPGGWSIVGRTPLSLYTPGADRPFLLEAGRRVRFRAIDAAEFDKEAAT